MFGFMNNDNQRGISEKENILDRAERKHGGQTTSRKVGQEIKFVCQKFGIGDVVTIKPTPGKGLHVIFGAKIEKKIGGYDKFSDFLSQLMEAAYDCGYNVAVGDNFLEIVKI